MLEMSAKSHWVNTCKLLPSCHKEVLSSQARYFEPWICSCCKEDFVMFEMSANWCNHMRDVAICQNSEQMPNYLFITQYITHTVLSMHLPSVIWLLANTEVRSLSTMPTLHAHHVLVAYLFLVRVTEFLSSQVINRPLDCSCNCHVFQL